MGRLTDNEVAEVAKMQKTIDNLEACLENLWLNLRNYDAPMKVIRLEADTFSTTFFKEVWNFVKFCKESHPEIDKEMRNKERQEPIQAKSKVSKAVERNFEKIIHNLTLSRLGLPFEPNRGIKAFAPYVALWSIVTLNLILTAVLLLCFVV